MSGYRAPYDRAAFLEDVRWLAETGESWLGAATRLQLSPTALEQRLRRVGAHDLTRRLSGFNEWNMIRRKDAT